MRTNTVNITDPNAGGEARRDEALAILNRTRRATIRTLQRAAINLALTCGKITADDLRAVVSIPPGIDPVVVGAAVRGLAVAGVLKRDGYKRSARPVAHCRPVAEWTLVDRGHAIDWLSVNPSLTGTNT